jgi:hypothetical protein
VRGNGTAFPGVCCGVEVAVEDEVIGSVEVGVEVATGVGMKLPLPPLPPQPPQPQPLHPLPVAGAICVVKVSLSDVSAAVVPCGMAVTMKL